MIVVGETSLLLNPQAATDAEQQQAKNERDTPPLSVISLLSILCFAFANGNLLSTYFLITLPKEAVRIAEMDDANGDSTKSIYLCAFIALAGLTQLVCPLVGMLSDKCTLQTGRRKPFMLFGGVIGVSSLYLQRVSAANANWHLYGYSFFTAMIGLNIIYSSMIGLIPDLVPEKQIGAANGIQAVLSVSGALFGFGYFTFVLDGETQGLYDVYLIIVASTILIASLCVTEPIPPLSIGDTRRMFTPLDWGEVKSSYYLYPTEHGDFFYVTVSRTLYYMGISAQAFFLYFLKDVTKVDDPEAAVSLLAAVGQASAAMFAYPVGVLSDRHFGKEGSGANRKYFIYYACGVLALGNWLFLFCKSLTAIVLVAAFVGAANGAYLTCDTSLAIDTIRKCLRDLKTELVKL
jgi:Na+/melibiose symporter-like transporter